MKKILILLLLGLCAVEAFAQTKVNISTTGNQSYGLSKTAPRVGVLPDGAIVLLSQVGSNSTRPRIYTSLDAATWGFIAGDTTFPAAIGTAAMAVSIFGDSAFFSAFQAAAGAGDPWVRLIRTSSFTYDILDTIDHEAGDTAWVAFSGVRMMGGRMYYAYTHRDGNTELVMVNGGSTWSGSSSWVKGDSSTNSIFGGSDYCIYGVFGAQGYVYFDIKNRDVYYIDTTTLSGNGLTTTLCTDCLPIHDSASIAGSGAQGFRSSHAFQIRDSIFLVAEMTDGDTLALMRYVANSPTAPTSISQTHRTAALLPAQINTNVLNDSLRPNVTFSMRDNGTVYAIYTKTPDTAQHDNFIICYRTSADSGVTWSSETEWYTRASNSRINNLTSPPLIHSQLLAFWNCGLGGGADTISVVYQALTGCANFGHSLSTTALTNTTATISVDYSNVTAPVDSIRFEIDNNSDFSSVTWQDTFVNAPDPAANAATGLTQNTTYHARTIIKEGSCVDTSATFIFATYKTIAHSLSVPSKTQSTFRVRNAYTANTVTKHILYVNTSNNFGSATKADSVISGITNPDTLQATGQAPATKVFYWWSITDELGVNVSAVDSVTTDAGDGFAPDAYNTFDALWIRYINPDSVEIQLGEVDSADAQYTRIAYSTTGIPNITEISSCYSGALIENVTDTFPLSVGQSTKVYFTIFAADENLNWSAGLSDSTYVPGGGTGSGDFALMAAQLDSLVQGKLRNDGANGNYYPYVASAVSNFDDPTHGRLLGIEDIPTIRDTFAETDMTDYASRTDTCYFCMMSPGVWAFDIDADTISYVANVLDIPTLVLGTSNFDAGTFTSSLFAADWFSASGLSTGAADEIATRVWASAVRTLTAEIWNSTFRDSVLNALKDSKQPTSSAIATANWSAVTRSLTDKADFSLSALGIKTIWDEDTNQSFDANSLGRKLGTGTLGGGSGATAAEVWNYPFASAFTAGSMGDSLNNSTYMQGSTSFSLGDIADAVWDESAGSHIISGTFGARFDASISSRSSHSAADVWSSGTRSLTSLTGFSLSDAGNKAIWNLPYNFAWTTASLGDLLTDSSFMSGPAAGLSVSQIVNGVWTAPQASYNASGSMGWYQGQGGSGSCIGAGAFTYSIMIRDTGSAPDSVIPNALVYVNNYAQNGELLMNITGSDGIARFNLAAGQYVMFTTYPGFAYDVDSFTVTATASDTLRLYRDAGSMTTVAFQLDKPNSAGYRRAKVYVELRSVNDSLLRVADTIAPANINLNLTATGDNSGLASINLWPNALFTNDSSFYRVNITDQSGNRVLESYYFRVPVSDTTVNFANLTRWR